MSFFSGLKAGFGLGGDAPSGPSSIVQRSTGGLAFSGQSSTFSIFDTGSNGLRRGSEELLSTYRNSPHVRKVVGLIGNQLAATEFYLEKNATGRGKSKSLQKAAQRARGVTTKSMDDNHVTEHPFLDFLYAGNPVMAGPTGLKVSFIYFLLKGEFFWMLTPQPDGSIGWMVIPPTWVQGTPGSEDGDGFKVKWGTKMVNVPPEMMLWVKDPDVLNPFGRGSGIGDSLRDEVDTDEYASALLRTTLANKGLMEGVLQIEEANEDSLRAMRLEFERNHRGTSNSGKVMVVDGTTVKYVPLTQAFSELRLLELRDAEKTIIEETFCVPPELFGKVTNSNRATIYEARNIFANNVLIPILSQFVTEISLRLLPIFDPKNQFSLDYVSPAPSDEERLLELLRLSPQSFTSNEIRQAADFDSMPWGDVRYVPANLIETPAPLPGRGKQRALGTGEVEDGSKKKS